MNDQREMRDQRREYNNNNNGQTAGRYNKTLCKHFSSSGTCPKRNDCMFAHVMLNPQQQMQRQQQYQDSRGGRGGRQYDQSWNQGDNNDRYHGQQQQSNHYQSSRGGSGAQNPMMNQMIPMELQLFAMQQQQQLAGQMSFLQTLLMHKFSVALNTLMPQIEQLIDKSKHLEQFKSAESLNRQGNPTGAAEILRQILSEGDQQEKDAEVIAEIEKAHKEAINIDQQQMITMLTEFGMTPVEITQLYMFYQQNLQMMGMQSGQSSSAQMMPSGFGDQAEAQS